MAESGRILHVPDGAPGQILTLQPTGRRRVGPRTVGQVRKFAEDIGERLIDGARLVVVEQVGREVRHPMRQLVADHVVGARVALAENHLLLRRGRGTVQ